MMYSEFFERTNKEVEYDEYLFIEDSYYDFNGNKDDFCKQWLADLESGKWELELSLRKQIAYLKAEMKEKIEARDEDIKFYRNQFAKQNQKIEDLQEENGKLRGAIAHAAQFLREI